MKMPSPAPLRLDLSATVRDRRYRSAAKRIDLAAVAAAYAAARRGEIRIGF
jgi:hypothetical protein